MTLPRDGRRLELSPIPMRILEILMRATPRLVKREEIERVIWGDEPPDSDALRAHVHVLRSVVDPDAAKLLVHTMRGIGYRIADGDAATP